MVLQKNRIWWNGKPQKKFLKSQENREWKESYGEKQSKAMHEGEAEADLCGPHGGEGDGARGRPGRCEIILR